MGQKKQENVVIILRSLQKKHMKPYLQMFSPKVRKILHVSSLDHEKKYLQQKILAQNKTFFYGIFEKKSDSLVGALEIREYKKSRGQLYCWLNENFWGLNYFQHAMKCASELYFSLYKTCFFTAHVDIENKRSYYALKKCGFADFAIIDGAYSKQYVLILRRK